MKIGMLWYDKDQKMAVTQKIKRAARYYARKYGVEPDICFVHPDLFDRLPRQDGSQNTSKNGRGLRVDDIWVRENGKVLPEHYWIGVAGEDG